MGNDKIVTIPFVKNLSYILLFFLSLNSCNNLKIKEHEMEFYSQDYKKYSNQNNLKVINLDSLSNFSELQNKMSEITCEGKISGITFNFEKTNYHVTGFAECPTSGVIGCYFSRNLLFIKNDSLINSFTNDEKNQSIEYLKSELDSIISKDYNFKYNEDKLRPALIHLYIEDDYSISKIKKVLKEIAVQFGNINLANKSDYFEYHILFKSLDFTNSLPPPPLPPVPELIKNTE